MLAVGVTCPGISALILDVDGVLTDNIVTIGEDGTERRSFSFRDVNGISIARRSGMHVGIITGESSKVTALFATRFGVDHVLQGRKDKDVALRELVALLAISVEEVAFMGDDIHDLGALSICGLPACPSDAHEKVKSVSRYISSHRGGHGAVRDLVDFVVGD